MFSKQFEIKPVWLKKSSMTGPPLSNTFFLSFDTILIQGDFFNWPSPENVSRLAPPQKMPRLAPALLWKSFKYGG